MNDSLQGMEERPTGTAEVEPSPQRPSEREIYRQLWGKHEAYRVVAPGEYCAHEFLKQAVPPKGASVLDLGCGTGRGGFILALLGGMNVTLIDFADNCLDDDIHQMLKTQPHALRFIEADLTKEIPVQAAYGFCTDVMEHIPPEDVRTVLTNCLKAAQHVFFQISTVDDLGGALVGHRLHLSVHPYAWWLELFHELDCVVHWSREDEASCLFYVTAWASGPEIVAIGALNTTIETVRANVKHNISAGWEQVTPHETNDVEVMVLGGGPSLNAFEDDIKRLRAQGVKLITMNGTYGWCLEHGLTPSAQIMVDARPFNARFTHPVVDQCKYLIASQCDPTALEGLPRDRTLLWHTTAEMIKDLLAEQYKTWWGIPGGSTILLRSLPLLRMLGFKQFHLFGCDSCLAEGAHHAYVQPENDDGIVVPVNVGGRIFYCHPWMIAQAQEFMDLITFLGDEIEVEIYGDGLLNHILLTGAELSKES